MAKRGIQDLLPPTESPEKNIEAWLDFFARCKVRFRNWTDPVSGEHQIVIRRSSKELCGGGRHLLGKFTRKQITDEFLNIYGRIEKVNSEIKKKEMCVIRRKVASDSD